MWGETGGRAGLERLLREYWNELEADFRRHYHLRLSEAVHGQAGTAEGRLPARELLSLIHGLAAMPDSLLSRKLRGSMADWDLHAMLLRHQSLLLAGANWQRSGGKGSKPKPIPLPDARGRGDRPSKGKPSGENIAQRLRNLGLIPTGSSD